MEFNVDELEKIAENHRQTEDYLECARTLSLIADFFEKINDENKSNFYYKQILECFIKSAEMERNDFFEAAERWCSAASLAKTINTSMYLICVNKLVNLLETAAQNAIKKEKYLEAGEYYLQAGKFIKDDLFEAEYQELYKKAIKCYIKVIDAGLQNFNTDEKIKFYLRIATLYGELNEYDDSIKFLDKALKLLEVSNSPKYYGLIGRIYYYKANCLKNLSSTSSIHNDLLKKAINYLRMEAEFNLKINKYLKAAESLSLANWICEKMHNININSNDLIEKEALCYLNHADLLRNTGNVIEAAKFERDAAYCYYKLNIQDKAVELLLKSAEYLKKEKEYIISAEYYRDVSLIFKNLNDYLNCGKYAYISGLLAKDSGYEYRAVQNFKIAYSCFNNTGEHYSMVKCSKELINCLNNIAKLEYEDGNYHLSGTYFLDAAIYSHDADCRKENFEKAYNSYKNAIELA
ncbi:MAG: hypothetical protein ACTSRP_27770 [Candidatus Helarchaeota archaeon]